MHQKIFNVRVYGILINNKNEMLVVQETIQGMPIIKFPGGGLEFGEGIKDCLIREFKEELGIDIEIESHFYTTDFFVPSIFNHSSQVIAVYYLVSTKEDIENKYLSELKTEIDNDELFFSWMPLLKLEKGYFTLPIDKHVAGMISKTMLT